TRLQGDWSSDVCSSDLGWAAVERRFRDGHTEIWWAAELTLGGYGPDKTTRLVAATTDPATLPEVSTWYLATILPRPGSPQAEERSEERRVGKAGGGREA